MAGTLAARRHHGAAVVLLVGVLAYRWPQPLRRTRLGALRTFTTFGPTRRRYTWLWQGGLDDLRPVPFATHLPGGD